MNNTHMYQKSLLVQFNTCLLDLGPIHTTWRKQFENATLFQHLGLPSTLIHHKTLALQILALQTGGNGNASFVF